MKISVVCLTGLLIFVSVAQADIPRIAKINNLSGKVEVQRANLKEWIPAKLNMSLYVSDKVRTGKKSMVEIILDDGSFIRLRENSVIEIRVLDEDKKSGGKKSIFRLPVGKLFSKVQKLKTPDSCFEVHTPAAVAGVRGTEFSVFASPELFTRISVFTGRVEVQAIREEMEGISPIILNANQSTGFGAGEIPEVRPLDPEDRKDWKTFDREMKQPYDIEVSNDIAMEQMRQSITQNLKDADYQMGKSLVDVHGNRVRLEEYLLRPRPEQLQFLILNTRENRFDYASSLYTFNKALPDNFSPVVREAIKGRWNTQPDYWLTGNEAKFGNHYNDYMNWVLSDGYVEPGSLNNPYWEQKFVNFVHTVNGIEKIKCTNLNMPSSAQTWYVRDESGNLKPVSQNYTLPGFSFNRDPEKATSMAWYKYEDGTWEQIEFYVIDDQGNLLTWEKSGTGEALENDNGEVRLTASEFNGRDIDVVYSPKILIDANRTKW